MKRDRACEVALFLLLLFCFAYFFPRWADWNQNSRLDLVLAIVDKGTFAIDDYYQNTGDYAYFEGHYYSDKAPGTSFLGVPFYWVFARLARLAPVDRLMARLEANPALAATLEPGGTDLEAGKVYFAFALTFVTFFTVAVPSAFMGVLLYRWTGYVTPRPLYRLGVPLAYGLLTNAFAYSNMFFGHQIVAALLFGAFYLLFRIDRREISPAWLTVVGLMLGYAVITEYPTALIAAGLCVYAFFVTPDRRWLGGLVLGGLLPGVLLAVYNLSIFHTPLPVGYRYSVLYTEQHSYGFLSISHPRADALWGITFGSYRGLFFLSPILLLAAAGFVPWWRRREFRRAGWVCAYAVAAFFLFNGSSVMWQGGWSVGPRYLLPMLPFLAVGLAFFWDAWGGHVWARAATGLLASWSFFAVWAETIGGQHFPDWTPNPLFNYSLPQLLAGNVARNVGMVLGLRGWASLIPLLVVLGAGAGVILYRVSRGGRSEGAMKRLTDWLIALGLFLIGILTRLPFRSRFLYHWDSVNFALGLERFDVYQHQPHPPGYFLYVMTGRLVHLLAGDANASLVWVSVVATGLAVAAMFWLGRSLWNREAGLTAAFLLLTSPLFWFHGEVALSYMVEAAFVIVAALLCYRHLQGTDDRVWLSALVLGVAGGFRPNTMVFLLPLWAVSVWRYRWWKVLIAVGVLGGICLAWAAPMVILTGGVARYQEALRAAGEIVAVESSFSGLYPLAVNGFRLGMFTVYALGVGIVPLVIGGIDRAIARWPQWRVWVRSPEFRLFFWWPAPSLLFYTLIHIRQPGHTFTFMPAVLLLLGGLLAGLYRREKWRRWAWTLTGAVVLVNALLFLTVPPSLFGGEHITLTPPAWPTIRARDASLESRIGYIRAYLDPAETVILSSGLDFRHPDFYLREYPVVRFAELPVTMTLSLPDSVRTVVLFGEDLIGEGCPASNPGASVSPGLCLLARHPEQRVVVEGYVVHIGITTTKDSP